MPTWLSHYWPHAAAGTGTVALIGLACKDVFREWWRDYTAERKADRDERAAEKGKGDRMASSLVDVLRQDLAERRGSDNRMMQFLERLASSGEKQTEILRQQTAQLDQMQQRLISIQGSVGRYQ